MGSLAGAGQPPHDAAAVPAPATKSVQQKSSAGMSFPGLGSKRNQEKTRLVATYKHLARLALSRLIFPGMRVLSLRQAREGLN